MDPIGCGRQVEQKAMLPEKIDEDFRANSVLVQTVDECRREILNLFPGKAPINNTPRQKPCLLLFEKRQEFLGVLVHSTWDLGRHARRCRSEERRVGKECRSRWWREHQRKKERRRGV